VGPKQPARTTARKQVAPVSKEHQGACLGGWSPNTGGIPAHRARRLAVYRSATRLAKPQAGRALRRSRAPAQAEQSTTRVSMNAATWEVPRHAACHPQTGCIRNWRTSGGAGSSGASSGSVVSVELGLGEPTAAAPAERFLPSGLVLYSYAGLCWRGPAEPKRPVRLSICVPKPDAGIVKDAGSPDGPICLGPPPPCALPPRPVPLGRSWSLRPAAAPDACRWTVEPATLGNQTRR